MTSNWLKNTVFLLSMTVLPLTLYARESALYFILPQPSGDFGLRNDVIISNTKPHQTNLQINAYDLYGVPVAIDNSVSKLEANEVRIIDTTHLPSNVVSLNVTADHFIEGSLNLWTIVDKQSTTLPSLRFSSNQLSFPMVADSNFSHKWLMLFNPSDEYVIASILGVDKSGEPIGAIPQNSIVINPKETKIIALAEIFDTSYGAEAVRLVAEKPLIGYEFIYNPAAGILEAIPTIEEFLAQNSSARGVVNNMDANQGLSRNLPHYLPAATTPTYKLTVLKKGTGSGKVTGDGGIDCGKVCSKAYDKGANITLKAVADTNSTFDGWSGGGCSGSGDCSVKKITSAKTVTAKFTANPNPDLTIMSLTAPTKGTPGKAISLSTTVINIGELIATPPFRLAFYLSLDNIMNPSKEEDKDGNHDFTKGDLELGGCNYKYSLLPEQTNGCYGSFLIPDEAVANRGYYIGVHIDSESKILEMSETNNIKTSPISIAK